MQRAIQDSGRGEELRTIQAKADRFSGRASAPDRPVQLMKSGSTGNGEVIQLATKVSYFSSRYSLDARRYRRRHRPRGRNVATVGYQVKRGRRWSAEMKKSLPSSGTHSEKTLYDYLRRKYKMKNVKVNWLYTELATCGSDLHNCTARVERWFPDAQVYYSIDYPNMDEVSSESSDSEEDRVEKRRAKAKRRRGRGPRMLTRFGNKMARVGYNPDIEEADFNPPLRRINSPAHYSSGYEF